MPPEGERRGIEVENYPTEINKGAQYFAKIKPYATTIRRLVSYANLGERGNTKRKHTL